MKLCLTTFLRSAIVFVRNESSFSKKCIHPADEREEVNIISNRWEQESKFRGVDSAKLIEVIATEKMIGEGTEKSPLRKLTQIWSKNGELIASSEPLTESCAVDPAFRCRSQ